MCERTSISRVRLTITTAWHNNVIVITVITISFIMSIDDTILPTSLNYYKLGKNAYNARNVTEIRRKRIIIVGAILKR